MTPGSGSRPVLAADIGGTQMRAALVAPDGRILQRRSAPTPNDADVPTALIDLVGAVGDQCGDRHPTHAVIGLPGAVDYEREKLLWAPHLPGPWTDLLSSGELGRRLGLPVSVANDADLAAVGEALFGAGRDIPDVAYLTVSTGIGAGVVHDGHLLHGRRSLAEVGHTVIDWRAWAAGSPSTLEELASGSGLAQMAETAGLGRLDARQVEEVAASGDPRAVAIWEDAIVACAAGVANIVLEFSPHVVVVGGGLGRHPTFFERVRSLALSHAERLPSDLMIVPSLLGDDAGLVGAARWNTAIG